jgi:signal transduction histidine kinase/CheY-like chemotaxis protein
MRVVLLATALALLVSGLAMLAHELYTYRTTWATDLATEAGILASSVAPAAALDDHAAVERDLKSLEVRRRVMVAALYAADGRLYAAYVRRGEPTPPPLSPPTGVRTSGERVETVQPVQRNGQILGTIYLESRYDLAGRMGTYSQIFILATLLSMGAAFILSKRLQIGITEPLDAIVAVSHAVVEGRDYSLRAKKYSDNEIGIVVDAFNKMLEEVQARTRALSEADRRKDEFLATLAHELRNPLAPIRHAVKLLESGKMEVQQQQWAREVISRQVQRMALLLDDLLEVSRITRGRLDLKIETVDLDSLVRAAVETARPLIDAKQHRLSIDLPPQPISLAVDPLRMSQSLSNLLTNAAKYTDAGGLITLVVKLAPTEITMSVKDTGIGVEAQALSQVFQMFSQVDSAVARSEGGLGIGLALVRGLVELHGGTIEGYSAGLGSGSEFTIHLPRSIVLDAAEAAAAAGAPRAVPDATSRLKVMVADDNRDAADSLAMLLEMNGHEVSVVHCGEAALQAAHRERPHAVILDIGMPDVSGYEVARRIRAEAWGGAALLVAVTGWGQEDDKARARAAGFNHHLTKPVDPDEVEKLLQEFARVYRNTTTMPSVSSINIAASTR